ncbi:LysR family transcriptional regulator [Cupriavidus sp. AU9028]|uniref:LysR family transcriptional regulator n=1 Tax=Cupriavidus sp. AU9028 TaxID=2871157 RepID=UPI001C975134|nr:LysR family transcriptional regulator [Cupriavidus sp. AU9028]MBY4895843.1 LysR family transcriptional regulator [Cupriavidus sp. AU9028]
MLNRIDLSRVDLNLLVLFETVMEERHVGRAAARLHLTPSAISHGLGRLRRLLGDPLFLKTPRGVVPTARAMELAEPVARVLRDVRSLIESGEPFEPARSVRRFTIGAPDAVAAVLLPPLLATLRQSAPHVDIGIRQLLPRHGEPSPALAWRDALAELETRAMDVCVMPYGDLPARFVCQRLYQEEFVIAMRAGHPFLAAATLQHYCTLQHLVVSDAGDPFGFVDAVLAQHGLSRRVALTVPNFLFALGVLSETDLVAALPQQLVAMHGGRYGVASVAAPVPLGRFDINLVVPKVALMDAGLAWLVAQLAAASEAVRGRPLAVTKAGNRRGTPAARQ